MSSNLCAEVSKLSQRQAELAAQRQGAKKKPQKKPKPEAGKAAPKRKDVKNDAKAKLLATRAQRATEGISAKSRRYKDPLNKRLKDVIDILLKTRQDMSKDEICSWKDSQGRESHVDGEDGELWTNVMKNQRIEVLEDGRFRYRPRHHHIVDKEQLLMHVRRHPSGTLWGDVSDTYVGVEADWEALVAERKAFVIENPDIEDKVIFWNDPTVEFVVLSDQMLECWRETQPPLDERKYKELMENAEITQAQRKASRKREAVRKVPKDRKARDFKHRKITNTHMPELFKSHQPEQID